jgi:hypothetical protein
VDPGEDGSPPETHAAEVVPQEESTSAETASDAIETTETAHLGEAGETPAEVTPTMTEAPSDVATAQTDDGVTAQTDVAPSAAAPSADDSTDGASEGDEEPRLPAVGTVLKKVDRDGKVRCECAVEADGKIRYRNTVYTSLSAAAAAAAGDLGLTSKSLNGWLWWGVVKAARKEGAGGRDPVKLLDTAWTKFRERINALLSDELADDAREKLVTAVRERAEALAAVACSAQSPTAAQGATSDASTAQGGSAA